MTFLAMPMTCHPSLERQADGVRAMIGSGYRDIVLPVLKRAEAIYSDKSMPTESLMGKTMLRVNKAVGGAPFIGDSLLCDAKYVWYVAQDDAGRWIATDSELRWRRR